MKVKILGWGLSLVFLYFTFRDIKFESIVNYLHIGLIKWVLLGFLFYFFFFISRAYYQISNLSFILPRFKFRSSLRSIAISQFYNSFLPARLGEIARMNYLCKEEKISKTSYLSFIFLEKVIDLVFMLIFLLAAIVLGLFNLSEENNILILFLFVSTLIVFIFIYIKLNESFLKLVLKLTPGSCKELIINLNKEAISGLNFLKTKKQVFKSIVLLTLSWGAMLLTFWAFSHHFIIRFGFPIYTPLILLISSCIAMAIPSAPAGAGTIHYGIYLSLLILNKQAVIEHKQEMLSFIIVFHFLSFCLDFIGAGTLQFLLRNQTKGLTERT